jgi:integrase
MTTVKLKGINTVPKTLASGEIRIYRYHRPTGTLLPGKPGSPEFMKAYHNANTVTRYDTGTISQLIREYKNSPKFPRPDTGDKTVKHRKGHRPLSASTQREYKRMLAILDAKFGTMPIAALAAPRVIGKFIGYQEEIGMVSPREADNRLMTLSAVFTYSFRKGLIARNPLIGFETLYQGDRSHIIWLEPDITLFMDGAPVEMQRAMILALHTGQRYGDLIRLRWSDYDGKYVSLRQRKSKVRLKVKMSAALKRMLDSTPKACPYILARPDGRPWFTAKNDKEMGKAWRERMEAIGLHDIGYLAKARNDFDSEFDGYRLHLHDVRGTAVTLLSEAGCTIQEVCSITGHTLANATKILEKYLARTKTISDAAIFKFETSVATQFANRLQTGEAFLNDPEKISSNIK